LAAYLRFQLHFTLTSASWLNLVKRWFGLITAQAIRRGSFDSVRRRNRQPPRYLGPVERNPRRFQWTKSVATIKRGIRSGKLICETRH
jgi:hypothetical protein